MLDTTIRQIMMEHADDDDDDDADDDSLLIHFMCFTRWLLIM